MNWVAAYIGCAAHMRLHLPEIRLRINSPPGTEVPELENVGNRGG
jgi:hypothetical protein